MNSVTFWRFVLRRQMAWAAKNGLRRPFRDPVMERAKFTNVFRALDRGTLFAIYELLKLDTAQRAWSVAMYRAMNRIDAFQALLMRPGGPGEGLRVSHYMAFRPELFIRLAERRRADGGAIFTGVYQSTNVLVGKAYPYPGQPMDCRLASYGLELANAAAQLADHLGGSFDLSEAMAQLRDATKETRLGPFAAHQGALDLQYAYPNWGDDWVHVGPGAKAGLRLLGMKPNLDALRELALCQPAIPYAPLWRHNGKPARLSLPDVEHALCEWQKYERIRNGGHTKGLYTPSAPPLEGGGPGYAIGYSAVYSGWRPPAATPPWWFIHRPEET